MPIYEYECPKCGRIEEVLQKISDKPLTQCKHCSGKLHKLVSQSTFHLKGTGWYVTDYAGKSKGASEKSNKSKDTSSSNSATSTSEKKTSPKAAE
jgi:putative FmdB family regulatory protein